VEKYPAVSVHIQELVTEQIIDQLKNGLIDVGLVVTPLLENGITEIPLFQEPFVVYASNSHPMSKKETVNAGSLETDGLWLLTEGHCFRSQVMNLCGTDRLPTGHAGLRYETGSLETLIKLIDRQQGFTLLPYLATLDLDPVRKERLRSFEAPQPVREVSLVTHRSFLKRRLINALQDEILLRLPQELLKKQRSGRVVVLS
jgi:LysR family hydrogen peroxide-inducible transcriptional activator